MTIFDFLPINSPVRILDLGAMLFPGEPAPYAPLLGKISCEVIGFEVLPDECKRLANMSEEGSSFTFLPLAVGDGSQQLLRVCSMPSRSSLFAPNDGLCARFAAYSDYIGVVDEYAVQTHRLDDLSEVGDVDWIKMDIQGAELQAIQGGTGTFSRAVVIHTEVKFLEQYRGQPLFAEVDQALRDIGFMFHTFLGYGTRPLRPVVRKTDPRAGFRQWLWADAVYLPELTVLETLSPQKLLKAALILHEIYQSYDFAHAALAAHDLQNGTRLAPDYLRLLEPHLGVLST